MMVTAAHPIRHRLNERADFSVGQQYRRRDQVGKMSGRRRVTERLARQPVHTTAYNPQLVFPIE